MLRVMGALDDRPDGDGKPVQVSVDAKLHRDLITMKTRNTKFWDTVAGIDGGCGVGKSQMAICTIAPLLAKKMSNIHITFDIDEFTDVCVTDKSSPGDVIVLDEGHAGLNTSQAQKADFQRLINLLMLIRKKGLFLIIITQCFFELSKSMAIFRMNVLYHVYEDNGKRGGFTAFGRKEKKDLYILGRKFLNYRARKYNYVGQFNKNRHLMPLDYELRKDQHLLNQNKQLEKGSMKRIDQASKIMDSTILNLIKLNFKQEHIARIMGLGVTTVKEHWRKMKDRKIVPEEYLTLYKNRNKTPITPTKTPTGDFESNNTEPKCYNIIPNNAHTGAVPTNGGENEENYMNDNNQLNETMEVKQNGKTK